MRTVFAIVVTVAVCCSCFCWAAGDAPAMSADEALRLLKEGNSRFIASSQQHPNEDVARRNSTATKGQQPFATILSCSDSRVPVEVLFDRGVGDIFVIRVAGNVANGDETGSIEYAVDHLGTPVLVVLGHTKCGAVTAVVTNADLHGNIIPIGKSILPAVVAAKKSNPTATGEALLNEAIKANVWQAIEDVFRTSPITVGRIKSGKLRVEGALYDIETGNVTWMGKHPKQDNLLSDKAH
ncbi:MAG: carbonic anhydrase [Desulfomonile tiedjei]|uniref:Carbonic anhydrase n=1 Tax=Desulfomonile tiedjei TaxID=2358 RepID=A0A9D6Z795_9BACT|nr:carbonic anhydrase [Desulfomonile tiedjei]